MSEIDMEKCGELTELGFAFLHEALWDQALEVAKELETLRFSAAFDIAAQAHAGKGDMDQAVGVLERGLGLAPRAWSNWHLLGNYLADLDRLDEAAEAYTRALDCPGVWTSAVALDMGILANLKDGFEEALRLLGSADDPVHRVAASEQRIRALVGLGRDEDASAEAERTLAEEFDRDRDSAPMGRIAAALGRIRLRGGATAAEVRAFAKESLALDHAAPALLALIREIDGERSPSARYFRVLVDGRDPSLSPAPGEIAGFAVTYDLVADTPEDGLRFVADLEALDEGWTLEVDQSQDLAEGADDLLGVYWRSGHAWYEAEDPNAPPPTDEA